MMDRDSHDTASSPHGDGARGAAAAATTWMGRVVSTLPSWLGGGGDGCSRRRRISEPSTSPRHDDDSIRHSDSGVRQRNPRSGTSYINGRDYREGREGRSGQRSSHVIAGRRRRHVLIARSKVRVNHIALHARVGEKAWYEGHWGTSVSGSRRQRARSRIREATPGGRTPPLEIAIFPCFPPSHLYT